MSYVYNPFDVFAPAKPVKEYLLIVGLDDMKYRVKLTLDTISIGGKRESCVQLTIHSREIAWVKSSLDGQCELTNKPTRGETTIKMIHIALWFLKNGYKTIQYPDIDALEFTDSSKFDCRLPDGSVRQMSMMHRYVLLYGQTFYQSKLGAEPLYASGKKVMELFQTNWSAPKQGSFQFSNDSLNKQLLPLFETSPTWKDFMKKLVSTYGSIDVCQRMYPWYLNAVTKILDGYELPTRWVLTSVHPTVTPTILGPYVGGKSFAIESKNSPAFYKGLDLYNMPYVNALNRKTRRAKRR